MMPQVHTETQFKVAQSEALHISSSLLIPSCKLSDISNAYLRAIVPTYAALLQATLI